MQNTKSQLWHLNTLNIWYTSNRLTFKIIIELEIMIVYLQNDTKLS